MYHCIFSLVTYFHPLHAITPLLNSLNALAKDCPYTIHLRILENSSSYLSFVSLKSVISEKINLSFFRSVDNLGFGTGHNFNLLSQLSFDDSCFIIVNPDISFQDYEVASLIHWFRSNPGYSCVSPLIMLPNGNIQYTAKRNPSLLSLFLGFTGLYKYSFLPFSDFYSNYLNLYSNYTTDVIHCPYLSGCFLLIKPSSFKAISGFDQKYFLHLEDADIVRSLSSLGKTAHIPWFRVHHLWARGSHNSLMQIICVLKSMIIYFGKWGFRFF